jgi:hypothetical protein
MRSAKESLVAADRGMCVCGAAALLGRRWPTRRLRNKYSKRFKKWLGSLVGPGCARYISRRAFLGADAGLLQQQFRFTAK